MSAQSSAQTDRLETELRRMQEAQLQLNKTKACLCNLILYSFDDKQRDYFKQLIHLITDQYPCRVIVIHEDRESQSSYLNLRVVTDEKGRRSGLPYDQMIIEVAGDELEKVPFLIIPYFVPDLPIYLMWGEDPGSSNVVLSQLQKVTTRFIFDSDNIDDLKKFSLSLLSLLEHSSASFLDMNWARIGGWREMMAQTFDSPERFQQLAASRSVKVLYNNSPSDIFDQLEIQAIYFQAWLAAQLQWEFVKLERKNERLVIHYKRNDQTIKVSLEPDIDEHLPSGELVGIEISNQENYFCEMERQKDQVVIHCSTQYQCELPFKLLLPNIYSGRTLMQEIFYQRTSEHYIHMLQLISRMDWR